MNDRQKNLQKIRALHKAIRWAALGEVPPEFAGYTLGGLAAEIKARMQLESVYLKYDPIQVEIPPGATFKDGKLELPEGTTFADLKFSKPKKPSPLDPRRN